MPSQIMDITRMRAGEKGVVVEIQGGFGLLRRLETLGIRPSVEITKVSAQFARGPVTVRVGNTHSALGFGMAAKIIIELI
jgi:ferrous iron transport protein A